MSEMEVASCQDQADAGEFVWEPSYVRFAPCGFEEGEEIQLTVDEYEAVRLIDFGKQTHEQCARQMGVSRTTVTEMYERARYKIADCIVNGKILRNYRWELSTM